MRLNRLDAPRRRRRAGGFCQHTDHAAAQARRRVCEGKDVGLHVRRADATHWSHVRTRGDGGGRAVGAVRAERAEGRAGSPQSRHSSCDRNIVRRTGPQNLRVFVLIIECGVWLCFRKYIIYPNINGREIQQLPCALPPPSSSCRLRNGSGTAQERL